jgi:regulator of sirC expression with transglutaminase-like and TPR domain
MPILLSALWMMIGERAGIVVEGIGLPGHFIVRVGGSNGVLADPFNGGRMLSTTECRQLVAKLSGGAVQWNDAFLHPVTTDGLLERVLRNLAHIWQRREVPEQMLRTARFYGALRPREAEPQLAQARIADTLGATALAQMLYRAVVDGFPSSASAEVAASRLDELRHGAVEIN